MGNGMVYRDCDCNDGQAWEDKEPVAKEPEPAKINRRSKAYKEAIENIMSASECTREEAVKVFESEFDKIA
jgi:hypothetical protein